MGRMTVRLRLGLGGLVSRFGNRSTRFCGLKARGRIDAVDVHTSSFIEPRFIPRMIYIG